MWVRRTALTVAACVLPFLATAAPASADTGRAVGSSGTSAGSAMAALATIPVKGRAPMTGYTRAQFGKAWADTDHNGCDTRNDVLRRDLVKDRLKPRTHG